VPVPSNGFERASTVTRDAAMASLEFRQCRNQADVDGKHKLPKQLPRCSLFNHTRVIANSAPQSLCQQPLGRQYCAESTEPGCLVHDFTVLSLFFVDAPPLESGRQFTLGHTHIFLLSLSALPFYETFSLLNSSTFCF
jgi:hypothetical protein